MATPAHPASTRRPVCSSPLPCRSRPSRPASGTTAGMRWSSQPATQVPENRPPGNSIRGPAEAPHQPIHHQRDPDRVGNVKPTGPSASATRPSTSTPSPHAALAGPPAEQHHQPVDHQLRPRPPATPTPMKGRGTPRLTPPAVAQRDRRPNGNSPDIDRSGTGAIESTSARMDRSCALGDDAQGHRHAELSWSPGVVTSLGCARRCTFDRHDLRGGVRGAAILVQRHSTWSRPTPRRARLRGRARRGQRRRSGGCRDLLSPRHAGSTPAAR